MGISGRLEDGLHHWLLNHSLSPLLLLVPSPLVSERGRGGGSGWQEEDVVKWQM